MTCDRIDELLSHWIEDDLAPAEHDAVSAHLGECLRCAAIVRDLTILRRDAARLPLLAPPRDLWDGIAARIESPVIELAPRRPETPIRRRTWQLAAAAGLLMVATSGITWTIATRGATTAAPVASTEPSLDPNSILVSTEPLAPEVMYSREIEQLRTILVERSVELDSGTVATVTRSLAAIDSAIVEARQALARDGATPFLHDQLNRALQKKLGVLRTVALLPVGAS